MPLTPEEIEAQSDALVDAPPESLLGWLTSQKLEMGDIDRNPHWGGLTANWRKRGILKDVEAWIASEKRSLIDVWHATGNGRVAGRIVRMFAGKKWADPALNKPADAWDSPELAVLPETLRWVFLHPAMGAVADLTQAAIDAYETIHPAPDQGAKNQLAHCAERDTREKFFARVNGYLMEEKKRLAKKPDGGKSEQKSDDPSLVDLEAEILRMRQKRA